MVVLCVCLHACLVCACMLGVCFVCACMLDVCFDECHKTAIMSATPPKSSAPTSTGAPNWHGRRELKNTSASTSTGANTIGCFACINRASTRALAIPRELTSTCAQPALDSRTADGTFLVKHCIHHDSFLPCVASIAYFQMQGWTSSHVTRSASFSSIAVIASIWVLIELRPS